MKVGVAGVGPSPASEVGVSGKNCKPGASMAEGAHCSEDQQAALEGSVLYCLSQCFHYK